MNVSLMKTYKKDLVFVMVCLCPLKIFCFSCFCAYDNRKFLFFKKIYISVVLVYFLIGYIHWV
jgi:hypothetical protein